MIIADESCSQLSVRNPDSDETVPEHATSHLQSAHSAQAMSAAPFAQQPSIGFIPSSPERSRGPSDSGRPWQQPASYSTSHAISGYSQPEAASALPYFAGKADSLPNPPHFLPPTERAFRTSLSDSDGRSSRSSLVFNPYYFGNKDRSWVNDSVGTPVDVQDVQLGSSLGAIGALGSSLNPHGYFAPR